MAHKTNDLPDATGIKQQIEEEFKAGLNRLNSLFNSIGDAIFDLAVEGEGKYRFNSVNDAFDKITGYNREKVIGRRVDEVIPEPSLTFILEQFGKAIDIKSVIQWEETFYEFTSRKLIGDVSILPIFNDEGKCSNLVGIIRDITESKVAEKTISMLAHAVRSVSECVSITDMTDKIIFVNNAFLKTYGYEEHELIGKSISIIRSPNNSHEYINEILPGTLRGGWHGEVLNLRKDGDEFPAFVSTSVILDEDKKPLALIGVTTDITERKKAEKELLASETRNKALLSAIPDLMFMFNREGIFIDFHTPDPRQLITLPESFIGRSVNDVLPKELAEVTMNHLREVFEKGKTSVYEYSILVGNEELIYESRIVACGNDLALSIVRDITDRMKMEYKMIQSERLAALGEMSAGMAHEINQPLNTLSILFDNILLEAKGNHSVDEAYLVSKSNKIFDNILRIKNLIDHVREFSRSQERYVLIPFNINESIQNALSMVSEQFKIAGIELKIDLEENLPQVKGNTYKFEQVILNLMLNSKDALFEKRNGMEASYPMLIKIVTQYDAGKICIYLEDNGAGVKEEHRDKIFQPFYTTKETGKGTGLGLSISYGLIRELNGEIDITSKVHVGTTIKITIPVKPEIK